MSDCIHLTGEIIEEVPLAGEIVEGVSLTGVVTESAASVPGPPGPKGDKGDPADLPIATDTILGGVKVGEGLKIDEDGTLSLDKSQIHEVPTGGEANQVLKKMSDDDHDYGWGDTVQIEAYGSSLKIL